MIHDESPDRIVEAGTHIHQPVKECCSGIVIDPGGHVDNFLEPKAAWAPVFEVFRQALHQSAQRWVILCRERPRGVTRLRSQTAERCAREPSTGNIGTFKATAALLSTLCTEELRADMAIVEVHKGIIRFE